MKIVLPGEVTAIISRLNEHGYEAYAVGGCIRDCIMQKKPLDWDITTSARPEDIKRLFRRTHDTGIAHGTVTVVLNHMNYEITTFRIDGEYLDNRHPSKVEFSTSLYDDLKRRDFTMNAIAYHWNTGCVDPFDGISDIASKLVRGVGNAELRFNEDALRMLRAIRFSARLGFEIEDVTWKALLAKTPLIKNISIERIRDELLKLLGAAYPEKLQLLSKSGLVDYVDAELAGHICNVNPQRLLKVSSDAERLVILLRGLEGAEARLKFFKLDNKTIALVTSLLTELEEPVLKTPGHIRLRLSRLGPEAFLKLTALLEAYGDYMDDVREIVSGILTRGDCIGLSTLAIKGGDLMALGITEGVTIGITLKRMLAHVLEYPADNTPEKLIEIFGLADLCL